MKIIISGGRGFVGQNLLKKMKKEGFEMQEITVIDKKMDDGFCQKLGVNFLMADLAEKDDWQKIFQDQEIMIILHAQIASLESKDFYFNNVKATENVIEAAKRYGIKKTIYLSSAAVLSSREDDYAKTKKQGEEIVKNSGLLSVIIRPSIIYGPGDQKNIGWLINFAKKWPIFPIPGHGRYPRQPIYVEDLCQIIINLIRNFPSESRVYNINGKEKINFDQMVKTVLKELKGIHLVIYLPIPIFLFLLKIYDFLFRSPFTSDQIKSLISGDIFPDYPWWEEFDIKPTPFSEGIKKIIKQ